MAGKKNIDFGIIIGENAHQFLSLDEYTEHFLLPFSPRFRNIDFAVSSLSSQGIKNIVVLTRRDKDIVLNYLVRGWPLINFTVFDFIDTKDKLLLFMEQYMADHSLEFIAVMKGNYPVWYDMKSMKDELEQKGRVAAVARYGRKQIYSCLITDRKTFIKKYEDMLLDESNLELDIIKKIVTEDKIPTMETSGYITPFETLKEYYDIHINMLDDYLMFDRFNAFVPIRGDMAMNISSTFGRRSFVINSIAGENVLVDGKIENSIIFSGVKIDHGAKIKNSLIFPGNHIGSDAVITNTIIDEYSEDNTIPNIESRCVIGSEAPGVSNKNYDSILNFGVTLIGKDVRIPSGTKIGTNCYIDSFLPISFIREHRILKDGLSLLRNENS